MDQELQSRIDAQAARLVDRPDPEPMAEQPVAPKPLESEYWAEVATACPECKVAIRTGSIDALSLALRGLPMVGACPKCRKQIVARPKHRLNLTPNRHERRVAAALRR